MPSTEILNQETLAPMSAEGDGANTRDGSQRKTKVAVAVKSTSKPTDKTAKRTPESKTDIVLKKLRSAKGASIEQLVQATGWQAHSVRGFLSGTVKKKLNLTLVSDTGKDGVRRYRIEGDGDAG